MDLFDYVNENVKKWATFEKRVELVTTTAHYINEMNKLNSSCNKIHHERKPRQIDSAIMTMSDLGFKNIQTDILNEKIIELKNSNIKNLSPQSKGEYYILPQKKIIYHT